MLQKMLFATNNAHKIKEAQAILPRISINTLSELGITEEIPETADTIEGNALQKVRYIYQKYGLDCFADDTGLEIEALGGEPGVYSARYAGNEKSDEKNIRLVLEKMKNETHRKAQFKTAIALIVKGEEKIFIGITEGIITQKPKGENGFGYDPIFVPKGFEHTFAELSPAEKNKISHRFKALCKLEKFFS